MKTTKEMIAIMQAHVDGKVIERKGDDGWAELRVPHWNWAGQDYRIKPEPVTGWIIIWPTTSSNLHPSEQSAKEYAEETRKRHNQMFQTYRIIRMVEADQ